MISMERPTCGTCPYLVFSDDTRANGWCQRYPPTLIVQPDIPGEVSQCWPVMVKSDHCGEHPDFPAYLSALKGVPER